MAGGIQAQLNGPPNGDNQKSRVTQWIGPVEVTITYSSPDVHGPNGEDRKGHIWGELVKYGFTDQGFGTSKAAPWRAGANENTTIRFSHDVRIDGKDIKAGTYALFLDVEKDAHWNWILSRNYQAWGSFFYDEKDDAARISVTPADAPYTEWLTYGFDDRMPSSAVAYLQWENKKVPMKIEVPNVNDLYIARFRTQLEGSPTGFTWETWKNAAQFCADNKTNLDQGLAWAETSLTGAFIGQENFSTLSTKANVLRAMGRNDESNALMDKAVKIPGATVQEIHMYGRGLLAAGQKEKAMEIFKLNAQRHPEDKFTPNVGLARGYTALGDNKNAIKHWEIAVKNIPDNQKPNAAFYEGELKKLKEAK
jgi:tetratricopeptide (TPR) repeat protein